MRSARNKKNAVKVKVREWLTDCGWTTALTETGVCTYGRSDALLKGSHVSFSRYVHRIIHCLQNKYITQCI